MCEWTPLASTPRPLPCSLPPKCSYGFISFPSEQQARDCLARAQVCVNDTQHNNHQHRSVPPPPPPLRLLRACDRPCVFALCCEWACRASSSASGIGLSTSARPAGASAVWCVQKKKKKHRGGGGGRETDRHTDTLTERKRGGRGCSCCVNFWGLALVCSPWQVTMCTKKHSDLACLGSAERPNTPSPARPTCPCFVC